MARKTLLTGIVIFAIALAGAPFAHVPSRGGDPKGGDRFNAYVKTSLPLLRKYCYECHSTKAHKGDLDLERFTSMDAIRKDLRAWQHVVEQLQAGEMPPKGKPQPTAEERKNLLGWVSEMLAAEARARKGDPGRVPLRRLSNAEYDATIRDLTGVDLRPAREFPADGAGGEGFTNAAESLSDFTPALLGRYLKSAKDIAEHAVLLPDGFRFSTSTTRRDWTDESLAKMRQFYAEHTSDGRLAIAPYVLATIRHREALAAGKVSLAEVAGREKLNANYLSVLWATLHDKTPSQPLDALRARWRGAAEKDAAALTAEIARWQSVLWKFVAIGSYRYGATTRQVANDPVTADVQSLKLAFKLPPGQDDVVLYVAARELARVKDGRVIWQRPRFEKAGGAPLFLADYRKHHAAFDADRAMVFAETAAYLDAVREIAHDKDLAVDEIARERALDPAFLKRWMKLLAIEPAKTDATATKFAMASLATPLELLDEKTPKNDNRPTIFGWKRKGADLPIVVANASDETHQIPGRIGPRKVAVHPMPKEFVAVAWQSPVAGKITVSARIAHAHPTCGNSVAWSLEHRRGDRGLVLANRALALGGEAKHSGKPLEVDKGDLLVLVVDSRDGNHNCDLTEIDFVITNTDKDGKTWNLAPDVANSIQEANPHADRHGNKDVWRFVRGASKSADKTPSALIPPDSLLGEWRRAAIDPDRSGDARKLARAVQKLLTGSRPAQEKEPNRVLFDSLVAADSVLLKGLERSPFLELRADSPTYGLPAGDFVNGHLETASDSVIEVRLPAALVHDREFVVEGKLSGPAGERVVLFQATTMPPKNDFAWDGKSPIVAAPTAPAYKQMLAGFDEFRRVFPWYLCFPNVVPTDEVVSLKMFHREDEPLERLFLSADQKRRIDHLWAEHRFITQQPIAENDYLPQFIGFVTQDQPKELLDYFMSQRPVFKQRADEFEKDLRAAEPKQWAALLEFADRAYRRPLEDKEKTDLRGLYETVRGKGAAHPEALRSVLARILVSPAFLFRIEKAPAGVAAGAVDDYELATRLSYFLWSSMPDHQLRRLAGEGKLKEAKKLEAETLRMLKDPRVRSLAIEFGTQWIHVRGLDGLKEKNEKLFPTFDAGLRQAVYEESILFFADLFQSDRAVGQLLDADHTFLNETLAKHYGIPGVTGPEWRLVKDVRKHGRGGILGLASVHAKHSGASRTSPVLRGNWVVETLLGEKLPRPPANVPVIPDEEGGDKLTTRQLTEKHVSDVSCAACHSRIDPYGFAFENFDAIGRWRVKDSGGLPVDAKAKLRDGKEFEGINGLREYLIAHKKDVIERLFCQRLLGYALGRATTLSDTSLIDEMVANLNKNDGRISAAVLTIVRSPQFRMIRGRDVGE